MKWILIVAVSLAGLVALAAMIGLLLPKGHQASLALRVRRTPEQVWPVITNYADSPQWRGDIKAVERVADQNGHPVWKETAANGWAITLEDAEVDPPRKLVRRIADPKLPFSGNWTFELSQRGDECEIRVTENAEVANPLFRLMSRMSDPSATIRSYLTALAGKFGEPPRLE